MKDWLLRFTTRDGQEESIYIDCEEDARELIPLGKQEFDKERYELVELICHDWRNHSGEVVDSVVL